MKKHLASLDKEELCDLATKRTVTDPVEINNIKATQWFEQNYGFPLEHKKTIKKRH